MVLAAYHRMPARNWNFGIESSAIVGRIDLTIAVGWQLRNFTSLGG
jgi:hypothetical protein